MRRVRFVRLLLAVLASLLLVPAVAVAAPAISTLDGAGGGGGRIDADLASDTHAQVFAGMLHVFTYDATHGDLRHGWRTSSGAWHFETLDGSGGAAGRLTGDVGSTVSAMATTDTMHVFYDDVTRGDLRHATFSGGSWHFETIDGAGGPGGRVDRNVGVGSSTAAVDGAVNVFYADLSEHDIRRGVLGASGWQFAVLDGAGGGGGRLSREMGRDTRVAFLGGVAHVLYTSFQHTESGSDFRWGRLRDARLTSSGWVYSNVARWPWSSFGRLSVRTVGSTLYVTIQWVGDHRSFAPVWALTGGTWTELPERECVDPFESSCAPAGLVTRDGHLALVYNDDLAGDFTGELDVSEWTGSSWTAPTRLDSGGDALTSAMLGGVSWVFYLRSGDLRGGPLT